MTWTVLGFLTINIVLSVLAYLAIRKAANNNNTAFVVPQQVPKKVQVEATADVVPIRTSDGSTLLVPANKLSRMVQAQLSLSDEQKVASTSENYELYLERLCTVKVPVRVKIERPDIWVAQQSSREVEASHNQETQTQ
jgi:hypothetical protein